MAVYSGVFKKSIYVADRTKKNAPDAKNALVFFNKAREIIETTTNHGTLPNTGEKDKPIYGKKHFGRIRDSINIAAESVYNQGDPNSGDWGQQTDGT